jgi:hypothetical protein
MDLVICTQPQANYLIELIKVLPGYQVKRVPEPGVPCDSASYQEWLMIIEDKGIEYKVARVGEEIDLGNEIRTE